MGRRRRRGKRTDMGWDNPRTPIPRERLESYLDHLSKTGRHLASAAHAGIVYRRLTELRKADPEFDSEVTQAMRRYGELLEKAAHDRGVDGWEEPVFHKGTKCGTVKRWSDRLLELSLKRHCPEYREKFQGEVQVTGGVLVVGPATDKAEWAKKYGGDATAPE